MGADRLEVPDDPIIPFIEGDGIGPDIWAAASRVFDAAVERAYGGDRRIEWLEVLAGEKAYNSVGQWLPDETVAAFDSHLVGIKGPLTTPVGGGIRSLNVALRQTLDLYACVRPIRWFEGVPSPVRHPELVDMVIFRENTEDVYAGQGVGSGDRGRRPATRLRQGDVRMGHPARQRDRAQAGLGHRVEAAGAGRHQAMPSRTTAAR